MKNLETNDVTLLRREICRSCLAVNTEDMYSISTNRAREGEEKEEERECQSIHNIRDFVFNLF